MKCDFLSCHLYINSVLEGFRILSCKFDIQILGEKLFGATKSYLKYCVMSVGIFGCLVGVIRIPWACDLGIDTATCWMDVLLSDRFPRRFPVTFFWCFQKVHDEHILLIRNTVYATS